MSIETDGNYPSVFERDRRIHGLFSTVMDEPVDFRKIQTASLGIMGYTSGEIGFDSLVTILESCQSGTELAEAETPGK